MAISITSLFPAKNQLNVPVASDITLVLESDAADLDIQTLKFYINGVEIEASAYYGGTNAEVSVAFFAKRKIKYKTRRYGEDDVRYGQRDIYPSIFQYGYRYICTIEIEDQDGFLFSENFSFVIEDGIFYNDNPPTSFYYPQTQAVANYTPEWARSRYDKYSNFQQLINPPAKFLQEIEDSLFAQISGYYVQTSNFNELSTLHKIELGGDFKFQTTVLDDGTRLQIPPEVTALKEITRYEPNAEYQNDIKAFYYNKLPSRLDETKQSITDLVILTKTKATDEEFQIDKTLERDGKFCVRIEDSTYFTQIINGEYRFLYCRVTGISREGKSQVEDLIIIDNDVYYTTKLWKKIETIQFINLPDNCNLYFSLDHARFLNSFVPDSFNHVTGSDVDKATFWQLSSSSYGSVLQHWVLLETDAQSIIASMGKKDLIYEFELMDIDGTTNLDLLDIDVDKFSNFLYGIDQSYLYIFDKREEYSTIVKKMPETNGVADTILNLDSDELGREDTVKNITINIVQKTLSKTLSQYRLSVLKPDGITNYILADNSIVTDKLLGSVVVKTSQDQFISSAFFYDLALVGDYLIKLEAVYKDGTTSLDTKIVRIHKKTALVKYKLERIFGEASIERMFVDFDQQLKILDSNNELHTIRFAKDNMLLDYNNSLIYFSEEYDEIEA